MRFHLLPGLALASFLAAAAPAYAGGAAPYSASRDPATFERSLQCLTEALYYEARSESDAGQRAVAQVVLNRVRHPAYPNTVCGVVYQGSHRTTGCQFSFTCTGVMGPIGEPAAWNRARTIAASALRGSVYRPVGLAVNYHTTAINPYWASSLITQVTVGAHIFYTRPDSRSVAAFSQAPGDYEPETFGRMRGESVASRRAIDPDGMIEQPVFVRPALDRRVPGRDRYAPIQVAEIPLNYRTYGARPGPSAATQASSRNAARPSAAAAQRLAPPRAGPRVVRQNGVRIVYGN